MKTYLDEAVKIVREVIKAHNLRLTDYEIMELATRIAISTYISSERRKDKATKKQLNYIADMLKCNAELIDNLDLSKKQASFIIDLLEKNIRSN